MSSVSSESKISTRDARATAASPRSAKEAHRAAASPRPSASRATRRTASRRPRRARGQPREVAIKAHDITPGSAAALALPRVVIAGRPNAGKSSLFNRLLRRRKAVVDPTPGVTRDVNEAVAFFDDRAVLLVDTGGFEGEEGG